MALEITQGLHIFRLQMRKVWLREVWWHTRAHMVNW